MVIVAGAPLLAVPNVPTAVPAVATIDPVPSCQRVYVPTARVPVVWVAGAVEGNAELVLGGSHNQPGALSGSLMSNLSNVSANVLAVQSVL